MKASGNLATKLGREAKIVKDWIGIAQTASDQKTARRLFDTAPSKALKSTAHVHHPL
ncbi:MAG: hypothetical protein Q9161_007979 [Pseudevernia consocians]